jgi:hypothetical protein
MERQVRVVSTVGEKKALLQTEALTFGELKGQLSRSGYDLSNTKVIEGKTQVTFDQEGAQLPMTDFTVFIMPVRTKSGADWKKASYGELRAEIKKIKSEASETAFKATFGNYTQLGAAGLAPLVEKWYKKSGHTVITPSSKTVAPKAPVTSSSVKAVAEKKIKPIAALQPVSTAQDEVLLTIAVPIGSIPTGIYSKILSEREEEAVRRILR